MDAGLSSRGGVLKCLRHSGTTLRLGEPITVQVNRCTNVSFDSYNHHFCNMRNDGGRSDNLVSAATTTNCQSTRGCSSRRSIHNETRYVFPYGIKLSRSSKKIPDGEKANMQSVPEIIWAQEYDYCGYQSLMAMLNRFGKEISNSYDPWEVPVGDDDVHQCDRKDEMFEEMNQRKRARELKLAGLTYEGDPQRTSTFSGSRCLGGYVSWGAPSHCSECKKEVKFYMLYETTRDWEQEYDEQDQCWKKKKRRCLECEYKERLEEDVAVSYTHLRAHET